jgi:hypothetical protein
VRRKVWKIAVFLALGPYLNAPPAGATNKGWPGGALTVAIHDRVGVSAKTLAEAERTASVVFRDAGLDVTLVDCASGAAEIKNNSSCRTTQFPTHLHLTIAERSENLSDETLGVAYLGEDGGGCYTDIFFGPAVELHEHFQVQLGVLLGHVLAHEVAHLLLGTNSHSDTGIMRAHWSEQDLANASRYALLFTEAQAKTMRAKVAEGACQTEQAVIAARMGRD